MTQQDGDLSPFVRVAPNTYALRAWGTAAMPTASSAGVHVPLYPDYASLRRYLVDEGLLSRERGLYWRTGGPVEV